MVTKLDSSTRQGERPPIRVALVFPGCVDGVGGAETQACELIANADPRRVDLSLLTLGANPSLARKAHREIGSRFKTLAPGARSVWEPRVAIALWRYLRLSATDVVHLYGLRQEMMSRPISRWFTRCRVISAIRGPEDHRTRTQVVLGRLTAPCVDLWIANSEFAKQRFVARDGLRADRIVVVHNGITVTGASECEGAMPFQSGRNAACIPTIGCIANHLPLKRLDDVLHASARLRARGVRHRVSIVGRETVITRKLKQLACDLGVDENVFFLGYREDVRALIENFHVVVLASESESLPTSILEAMAAGLPVVATRVGGVPELVEHGETGFLVNVGDHGAMADALESLLGDEEGRLRMGAASRQRAIARFSMNVLVDRMSAVYEQLACRG